MGEGEKGVRRALTYDDRLAIERGLNRGDRVSWIARSIGRAPKVVAGEVRRNWTGDPRGMLVVRTRNICPGRPCARSAGYAEPCAALSCRPMQGDGEGENEDEE